MNKIKSQKVDGLSACYGRASGQIVYIKNVEDISKVNDNSIVVTDKITSEFTEAFIKARAVIAAKGGITCHAAIVCREQNIPCVVACSNAFDIFSEGTLIEIDTKNLTYSIKN